jgi:hypothetical protein
VPRLRQEFFCVSFFGAFMTAISACRDERVRQEALETKTQILVPIYNEGDNVLRLYNELLASQASFDSLCFIYDFDGDSTLPYIAQLSSKDPRVVADKNCYGRGVMNALKWGFTHAKPGPVIVVMGDNSDKLSILPHMLELWRQGATVVSPSRYMKGGKQFGGGVVKSGMSRIAGVSLKILGFPTADSTNNFKLYDGKWLSEQQVESTGGFEVALELCFKAFRDRRKIVELPTEWRDRTQGQSRFKLLSWTPKYLRWYFRIVGCLLLNNPGKK